MTKVNIKRLDSVTKNDTTATERINDNFLALQTAIENTLSRNGTGPNYMDADLDMNSYRIINSSDPVEDNDIVNLKYVEERIGGAVEASKTAISAASQATSSAQSALVSSTNAINTLRNAENTINQAIELLTDTQEYVDAAKADIDGTVEAGKQEINTTSSITVSAIETTVNDAKAEIKTTIDDAQMSLSDTIAQATEEVKQAALDAANEAISDSATTATGIVVEYANNEIKPLLNEIASNAAESAENASESAGLAASESGNAAISATDSQHYAEDSRIWAEGSDSEVAALDGEHSSKVWSEMAKTSATNAKSYADSLNPETFVKTSGNQDIYGNKTFRGHMRLMTRSGSEGAQIDWSAGSDSTLENQIVSQDMHGNKMRFFARNSAGVVLHPLILDFESGLVTTAANPPASDNSLKLATTAWVKNTIKTDATSTTITYWE